MQSFQPTAVCYRYNLQMSITVVAIMLGCTEVDSEAVFSSETYKRWVGTVLVTLIGPKLPWIY